MAVLSRTKRQEKLSLWNVSDPLRVTRLKSQYIDLGIKSEFDSSMEMDDRFIFISSIRKETTKFYFFSKKTLELHWKKTVNGCIRKRFVYDKGLLIIYVSKQNDKSEEYGVIQVYDVKSRSCFREMRITAYGTYGFHRFNHKVGVNSKFMVVARAIQYCPPYKLYVYDLEAVKNTKSPKGELLVHTLTVKFDFNGIVMTETEIFCVGNKKIPILDFSSFEIFRNKAKSVTLSSPWRSVWWSKRVDEEPLEPARHMEVYKEVLEHFHQLGMNCQKAIKRYQVVDPDLASFNLGDDFIGYRQHNPKMVIYDEEMKKRDRYINYQTVQISKATQVSVMGKTIQLIDVESGNVVNEMKLERDAIGFHFGGNWLVFVSEITGHEHILSVWSVDDSFNLTRIKDVKIGEYSSYEDSLQVDEHFISVRTYNHNECTTCNLISLKTFQVERSMSCDCRFDIYYDGGYLFFMNNYGLVRMLDVMSGTFLHDMPFEKPFYVDCMICRVNSNYVVSAAISSCSGKTKLYVYDLKCLKETDVAPTHLLLTTIVLECKVDAMMMNETRIVCLSDRKMYVVDLKPIDRLRCPNSC